jgi:hypothetical protein
MWGARVCVGGGGEWVVEGEGGLQGFFWSFVKLIKPATTMTTNWHRQRPAYFHTE